MKNFIGKSLLSVLFLTGLCYQPAFGMAEPEFIVNAQIINNFGQTVLIGRGDFKTGTFMVVRYSAGKVGSPHQIAHSDTKDIFIATPAGIFDVVIGQKSLILYDISFNTKIKTIDLFKEDQVIKIIVNEKGVVDLVSVISPKHFRHVSFAPIK